MQVTVLRDVVESETGAIFADPTETGLPPVQEGMMEYADASEGDKLFARLVAAYAEHQEGELTNDSLQAILSELEYLSRAAQRIAVKLQQEAQNG